MQLKIGIVLIVLVGMLGFIFLHRTVPQNSNSSVQSSQTVTPQTHAVNQPLPSSVDHTESYSRDSNK